MESSRPVVIERVETPRGELQLQQRGENYEVISNGCFLMATYNGGSEKALISLATTWAPNARRVLIGGLGVGYTLQAALASRALDDVTVIEIEPKVVEWNRSYLAPYNGNGLADPRTRLIVADMVAYLAGPPQRFDIIALDTDNGPDWTVFDQNEQLWSPIGLDRLDTWLAPGGVLAFWSASASPAFEALLRSRYAEVGVFPVAAAVSDLDDVIYLAR